MVDVRFYEGLKLFGEDAQVCAGDWKHANGWLEQLWSVFAEGVR